MILKSLVVGQLGANCYIAGDEITKEVIIIDPGDEGEKICTLIRENGYKVEYIILTHGHMDHISALKYVKSQCGGQVMIHKDDSRALLDSNLNLSALMGSGWRQIPADIEVSDGYAFRVGQYDFKIIHTPGHTPGGICILVGDTLFSGDTLFQESIGRTDLPGGNYGKLIQSIQQNLFKLEEHITVYPGHGGSTSIGHEKKYNPYI